MLSLHGYAVLGAGLLLLLAGLALGSEYAILAGALPLLFFLGAVSLDEPTGVEVERTLRPAKVRVGEVVRVEVRVRARKGVGLLEVHCPVPDEFDLVEGSNLHLYRKGRGPLEAEFAFTMRCTKRGRWVLPPVRTEGIHAPGVRAGVRGAAGPESVLEVVPRLAGVGRVRALAARAQRIMPEGDEARTGVQTTDFREIRAYAWGDPPRSINWKATARRAGAMPEGPGAGYALPLVNEYEREGKKSVWLLVDCGAHMEVGTSADNAFEHGLQAAGNVAKYYLDRGFTLGAFFYNTKDPMAPLYPQSGGQQFLRISQAITHAKPGPARATLREAVERCRAHLASSRPLVVLVTRVPERPDALADGLRRLRALTGRRRRKLPVLLVCPAPYSVLPRATALGDDAATLLWKLDRPAYARLRALGATVVEWDPRRRSLGAAVWGRA